MAIIVKGSGGKPEEEKTVTAGTSAIEVLPSSGKVMKKVTVNPTPSETKTVTPKASKQTVSPSSGKLLSKVTVNGDSNLVAGNIKNGVKIFGVTGTLEEGAKVATGSFTVTSATSLEINHGLGKIPNKFIIYPVNTKGNKSVKASGLYIDDSGNHYWSEIYADAYNHGQVSSMQAYKSSSSTYQTCTIDENNIIVPEAMNDSYASNFTNYGYYWTGTFRWIAIAE